MAQSTQDFLQSSSTTFQNFWVGLFGNTQFDLQKQQLGALIDQQNQTTAFKNTPQYLQFEQNVIVVVSIVLGIGLLVVATIFILRK